MERDRAARNSQALADGLNLNRIEDGHWDPNHPNDFYFFTPQGGIVSGSGATGGDTGGMRRLRFADIENPDAGATLTLLLDGSETPSDGRKLNKPDNMTIDTHGNLLIQEDPGNVNHIARILAYRIADGALGIVATFDPDQFAVGAPAASKLTVDEESSGIIDTEGPSAPAHSSSMPRSTRPRACPLGPVPAPPRSSSSEGNCSRSRSTTGRGSSQTDAGRRRPQGMPQNEDWVHPVLVRR